MTNLWRVEFGAKYTGLSELQEEIVTVVVNGDGLMAVAKAKRKLIGKKFDDGPYGPARDKWITRRVRFVKLRRLELLHAIDA